MVESEQSAVARHYGERCLRFARERDRFDDLSKRHAYANLALAGATLLLLIVRLVAGPPWLLWVVAVCVVALVVSYTRHVQIDHRRQHYADLWSINNEGVVRLRRDWGRLPQRLGVRAPDEHPYAADLDVLGQAGLGHLLGTAYTPVGRDTLQRWLLAAAVPSVVRQRQAAVIELSGSVELREAVALQAQRLAGKQKDYERFLRWAEATPWLAAHRGLRWVARLLPLLLLGSVLLEWAGVVRVPLWIAIVAVEVALVRRYGTVPGERITAVEARQGVFLSYADLFHTVATQAFAAPLLQRLRSDLTADGQYAAERMRRLNRLMPLAALRGHIAFPILRYGLLWDFHLLDLLEGWQRRCGQNARAWLAALGEIEALIALATLRHDQPAWVMPTLVEDGPAVLKAHALGHPLLADAVRVCNDVTVGPPGRVVVVTGSNMSGKSTLLRAIGLNVVLAQAGGPVCAAAFVLPPSILMTAMRVQDSLEQGLSSFMAELQRIKVVITAAEAVTAGEERGSVGSGSAVRWTGLYLLDEILHGTNTAERQIAARQIMRHLLQRRAVGAVSTHDLGLIDTEDLARAAHPIYFTETLWRDADGLHLAFDYRAHPGLAPSTNALALMELVGLPVDALPNASLKP